MMILLSAFALFIVLGMLASCRVASIADQQMEESFREWIAQDPERKRRYLQEMGIQNDEL